MAGIMPPGRLDTTANIADNCKVWKQMWTNYMVIAHLDSQSSEYKVALFLYCICVDALKIFNGFQFDRPEDKNDLTKIIEKLDQFTIGELNETFERYQLPVLEDILPELSKARVFTTVDLKS